MDRKKKKHINKHTIGRRDKANFPEFSLRDIEVKIDTGAYNSSIHCYQVEEIDASNGKALSFILLDPSYEEFTGEEFRVEKYDVKKVKSSNGQVESRYMIKTSIELFGENYEGFFSLTDRSRMRYPVLLGRKLLLKNFVVDVSKTYLSFKRKTLS